MADKFDKLRITHEKELNKLLKQNHDIQERINNGTKIQARTQEAFVKNGERILELNDKIYDAKNKNWKKLQEHIQSEEKISTLGKEHVDLANQLGKIVNGSNRLAADLIGLNSTSLALREKENNQILETLANTKAVAEMSPEELVAASEKVKANNALSEIQKQILTEASIGTLTQQSEQDILNKLELEGVDITKLTADQMERITAQVKGISQGTATLADNEMAELLDAAAETDATLEKWKGKVNMFGAALKNPALAMTAMKATAIGLAISFAKDLFDGALKFKQELGLGAGEAAKLAANVKAAEISTKLMGGDASLIAASASEMVKQFGDTSVFTFAIGQDMAGLALSTGFGGANAAKLLKTMEGISGASIETNINTLEAWGNLAKAEGVSSKIVLDDIASSTEEFAKFAKGGGDNIIKAATAAAKLGLEMSDVAKITSSLLSIESSLTDEMEAEMLIGKQLNLDKARELALAGDLEGVMNEVKNIGVSQAEWSEMNVIQRQALAKAVGVEVADMGKILAGGKTSAMVAEEREKTQQKMAITQERMMQGMMLMHGIGAAILVVETAANIQKGISAHFAKKAAYNELLRGGATVAAAAAESGFSAAKVPIIGPALAIAAIAAVGAAGWKMMNKKPPGAEEGGVVKESGLAEIHKGEVFSGTKNEMGFGADMTETNGLIKKHIAESIQLREQNQFLMNKLIRATGDLQLANA